MDYHFNDKAACKYGVEEAVMLNNLYYWVLKNKANNKHFHDGYYWTYNSLKAFEKLFPFWSKRQIERILNNLEKKKAIKTGNYNKAGYDRTKWYTITETVISIYANGEIDFTEWGNGNHETVTPIPNNKPVNKPNNKHIYAEFVSMTEDEYNKLIEKYGEIPTKQMIEVLDNYKGANGKKYKSDYRAILNWVVDKVAVKHKEKEAEGRANAGAYKKLS